MVCGLSHFRDLATFDLTSDEPRVRQTHETLGINVTHLVLGVASIEIHVVTCQVGPVRWVGTLSFC